MTIVTLYDYNMKKLFDIDLKEYNISLKYDNKPLDYAHSIANIDYNFSCNNNFDIEYYPNEHDDSYYDTIKKIYYDIESNTIVNNNDLNNCSVYNKNFNIITKIENNVNKK